jgi:hypothetical protein
MDKLDTSTASGQVSAFVVLTNTGNSPAPCTVSASNGDVGPVSQGCFDDESLLALSRYAASQTGTLKEERVALHAVRHT